MLDRLSDELGKRVLDEPVEGAREPAIGVRVLAEEEDVAAPFLDAVRIVGRALLDQPLERGEGPHPGRGLDRGRRRRPRGRFRDGYGDAERLDGRELALGELLLAAAQLSLTLL